MIVVTKASDDVIQDVCSSWDNRRQDWDVPSCMWLRKPVDGTEDELLVKKKGFVAIPASGSADFGNGDQVSWTGKEAEGNFEKLTGVTWSASPSAHSAKEVISEVQGSHTEKRYDDVDTTSWSGLIIGGTYDGTTFTAKTSPDYLTVEDGGTLVDEMSLAADDVATKAVTIKALDGTTDNPVTGYTGKTFYLEPKNAMVPMDKTSGACSDAGELTVTFGPTSLAGIVNVDLRIDSEEVTKTLRVKFTK